MKLHYFNYLITKYKFVELQIECGWMKWNCGHALAFDLEADISSDITEFRFHINLFGNSVSITWDFKCDHAGFHFIIQSWIGMINFEICDSRHWDYNTNNWRIYDNKDN